MHWPPAFLCVRWQKTGIEWTLVYVVAINIDELSNSTKMKANQFYRQWITDYRKEKNDRSGEPIQDGDLLDWIAEKFETGEFKQLDKPVVMQAEGSDGAEEAAVGQRSVGAKRERWE